MRGKIASPYMQLTFASIIFGVFGYLSIITVAHTYNAEVFGEYGTCLSILNWTELLLSSSFTPLIIHIGYRENTQQVNTLLKLKIFAATIASLALFFYRTELSLWLSNPDISTFLTFACLDLIPYACYGWLYSVLVSDDDIRSQCIAVTLYGFSKLLATLMICLMLPHDPEYLFGGMAVATAITAFATYALFRKRMQNHCDFLAGRTTQKYSDLLSNTLASMLMVALAALMLSIDTLMVQRHSICKDFPGHYQILVNFNRIFIVILAVVSNKLFKDARDAANLPSLLISRSSKQMAFIIALMLVSAITLTELPAAAIVFFFGEHFLPSLSIIKTLILFYTTFSLSIFLLQTLFYLGRPYLVIAILMSELFVLILASDSFLKPDLLEGLRLVFIVYAAINFLAIITVYLRDLVVIRACSKSDLPI